MRTHSNQSARAAEFAEDAKPVAVDAHSEKQVRLEPRDAFGFESPPFSFTDAVVEQVGKACAFSGN